jgi:Tol biopolymer transport system component
VRTPGRVVAVLVLAALLLSAPQASAQDSLAPKGALPHWIPNDDWVYEHWLPYDETRLYAVLGIDRGGMWRWLRDDAVHDLAQLARRRGMTAAELADRVMAPRRSGMSQARFRTLRARAYRIIIQGHLSQHIHFHSLHQRTIQRHAQSIFGVTPARFRDLRVEEHSPLEIGRMNGRSAVTMRRRAADALRRTADHAVSGGAMTRAQARRLLRRQLAQLPRWLGQRRNNGPPRTSPAGAPIMAIADWANHPTISADGTRVAFDQYRSTIPEARSLGEIRVLVADLTAPVPQLIEASHADGVIPGKPRSGYHSQLSADGRSVTFELADGNMNYAKRYGEMRVELRDLAAGATVPVSHLSGVAGEPSRTAYNPTVSGDGHLVAYEADTRDGATALWLADRVAGTSQVVGRGSAGAIYEPRLSADGRVLVFNAADAGTDGRSLVFVRDVTTGTTTLVSRASGNGASADEDAYEPSISADGRYVAFTSAAGNLGADGRRSRIWVRDVRAGTIEPVSTGGGFAFDPSISADGRYVAWSARPAAGSDPAAAGRATVWLYDRATHTSTLISRGTGVRGATADGISVEPAVSADGTRVAFTSTAANLDRRKPGGLTGVFLRDLRTGTTTLLSTHAPRTVPPVPKAAAASVAVAVSADDAEMLFCVLDS